MSSIEVSRRTLFGGMAGMGIAFLGRAEAAGASLAGRKLVIVICRGGMDGLAVSPPLGSPDYAALRGAIAFAPEEVLALDGEFGLHPSLTGFRALVSNGQARILPAVASPDRARSHFEAQDVLESGALTAYGAETGWLNRTLQALTPGRVVEALSVGATAPLILRGPAVSGSWSPGGKASAGSRLPGLLMDLYAGDNLLGPALAQGLETELMAASARAAASSSDAMAGTGVGEVRRGAAEATTLGRTVAGFMVQPGGPDLVAVSAEGYDTHANQGRVTGALSVRLAYLDGLIEGLRLGLGRTWSKTVVVCVTEFGRTARVNGTRGTDHGTASTALLAGGALKPGGIIGDWPGLGAAALFEGRDLRPTVDSRSLFKGLLLDHLGIDRKLLDRQVFPDSFSAAPLTGLV
jgi:uncharacterized protein (DUF1501 family)